jgi:hypothetical protein
MTTPAQFLNPEHPILGTQVILHLTQDELLQLAAFIERIPDEGRQAILANGLSVMVELSPSRLTATSVWASLRFKAGLVPGWTPPIATVAAQALPMEYPEPHQEKP